MSHNKNRKEELHQRQLTQNVELVVNQTGCTKREAKELLDMYNNDAIDALMALDDK